MRAEQGSKWQMTMFMTILMLPVTFTSITSVLNMVALQQGTLNALPLMVIIKMAAIWVFVSVPLTVLGTIFGRHWSGKGSFPCRVNAIPRPIPDPAW